jgi:hypothetical protein
MPDGMGNAGCAISGAVTAGKAATVAEVVVELSEADAGMVVSDFPEPPQAASASGRYSANSLALPRHVEFIIYFMALGPGNKPCYELAGLKIVP